MGRLESALSRKFRLSLFGTQEQLCGVSLESRSRGVRRRPSSASAPESPRACMFDILHIRKSVILVHCSSQASQPCCPEVARVAPNSLGLSLAREPYLPHQILVFQRVSPGTVQDATKSPHRNCGSGLFILHAKTAFRWATQHVFWTWQSR